MEFATLLSDNRLTFGFPYQTSDNHARLSFRKAKRDGLKLMLEIDKGQFLCSPYDCTLRVKFDDGKPIAWSGSPPSDHTSTVMFLSNASGFFQKMKAAKRVLIEPKFYQHSGIILEFDTAGLTLN